MLRSGSWGRTETFRFSSSFPVPVEELFAWHKRPGAFERLNPPWDPVEVVDRSGGIHNGARVTVKVPLGPVGIPWSIEHKDYIEGKQFCDVQVTGPFASWQHVHGFTSDSPNTSSLTDTIDYKLPFGALGKIVGSSFTQSKLERTFRYRHTVTRNDLAFHSKYKFKRPQNILISGASGLIGSSLSAFLTTGGDNVFTLVRRPPKSETEIFWDPSRDQINLSGLPQLDSVIHLSGEGIAEGRWTAAKKKRIRDSRVQSTSLLAAALSKMQSPPRNFLSASAVGCYGDRGANALDETAAYGSGFLSDVARDWENATDPAKKAGIRVVIPRLGVVLTPIGGALKKMITPFQLGLGGRLGDGEQYMSWILLDDLLGAFLHLLHTERISGPVNISSPMPVTNLEFTKTLGSVLSRPTIFPAPAKVLRLAFGEMAEEALLSSVRAIPAVLIESGFQFGYPRLEEALRFILSIPESSETNYTGIAAP